MKRTIVLLHLPGSSLARRIAACLEEAGRVDRLGSLDAPLDGGAVSVKADAVTWQGAELLEAGDYGAAAEEFKTAVEMLKSITVRSLPQTISDRSAGLLSKVSRVPRSFSPAHRSTAG